MTDIAIVGAMGTGKSTITDILAQETNAVPINLGNLVARVPLTLQDQGHDLFKLSKWEYINLVIDNMSIDPPNYDRETLSAYSTKLISHFGKRMPAELALATPISYPRIFDGVSLVASINHLKDRDVFVAGLRCEESVRLERSLARRRNGDAQTPEELLEQMRHDDELREMEYTVLLSDKQYDTTRSTPKEIANDLKKRLYLHV